MIDWYVKMVIVDYKRKKGGTTELCHPFGLAVSEWGFLGMGEAGDPCLCANRAATYPLQSRERS